jgi:hypothetical protein
VDIDRTLDSVQVQPARFRAPGDSTDVVLYANVPIRRMVKGIDLTRGVVDEAITMYDPLMRLVLRDSTRQAVDFVHPDAAEQATRRVRVPPGRWIYRIEALQPEANRAARAVADLRTGADRGFGMSDLVVADTLSPRPDRAPERWTDLLVRPNAGVVQRKSLGIFWETYGLAADSGLARYRVSVALTVLSVARPNSFGARVIGGIADAVGLSAKGDDEVALQYERRRPAATTMLDWLVISTGDTPPPAGRYRLTVTVTDEVAHRTAASNRELEIRP